MENVTWSDYRDWQAGDATTAEAIGRSEYRDDFMAVVGKFAAKAGRHERVTVGWWTAPRIYVQVLDDRKHYPCNTRALISFDLTDGTWAGLGGGRHYEFARKGWGEFVDSVAHWRVARYGQCSDPQREEGCPFPVAS